MTEVWQMTRAQFVGNWPIDDTDLADLDEKFGLELDELTRDWLWRTLRRVPGHEGFYFADIQDQPYDVALLHRAEFDGQYDVVGYYCGGHLGTENDGGQVWISPGVRDRGLAAALILEKAEQLGKPIHCRSYSPLGQAAHASAHKLAVQRAMRDGYRIPAHVMTDYPELLQPALETGPAL